MKILQAHEVLRLHQQDQKTLVKALLNPATPNKELLKAKQHYKKSLVSK